MDIKYSRYNLHLKTSLNPSKTSHKKSKRPKRQPNKKYEKLYKLLFWNKDIFYKQGVARVLRV